MELVDGLTPSVAEFIEYLASKAKGYTGNKLKWNEQSKFKAELMNVPERWRLINPSAFYDKAVNEGMRAEDAQMLLDWLLKAQAGKRLVPASSYKTYRRTTPPETYN